MANLNVQRGKSKQLDSLMLPLVFFFVCTKRIECHGCSNIFLTELAAVNELLKTLQCAIMNMECNQLFRTQYNATRQHACQRRSCHANSAKEL